MTTYNSSLYNAKQAPLSGGLAQNAIHMHGACALPSTLAANDTVNMFSLPANAVVVGCQLKAASQLDSNGSPTVTFDVGVAGTAQLLVAATSAVGRAAGVTGVSGVASAGTLYKNTTGKDLPIIVTCHTGPATGVAGTLELAVSYFVEDPAGSPA